MHKLNSILFDKCNIIRSKLHGIQSGSNNLSQSKNGYNTPFVLDMEGGRGGTKCHNQFVFDIALFFSREHAIIFFYFS